MFLRFRFAEVKWSTESITFVGLITCQTAWTFRLSAGDTTVARAKWAERWDMRKKTNNCMREASFQPLRLWLCHSHCHRHCYPVVFTSRPQKPFKLNLLLWICDDYMNSRVHRRISLDVSCHDVNANATQWNPHRPCRMRKIIECLKDCHHTVYGVLYLPPTYLYFIHQQKIKIHPTPDKPASIWGGIQFPESIKNLLLMTMRMTRASRRDFRDFDLFSSTMIIVII